MSALRSVLLTVVFIELHDKTGRSVSFEPTSNEVFAQGLRFYKVEVGDGSF
jgi:hypothetical protein